MQFGYVMFMAEQEGYLAKDPRSKKIKQIVADLRKNGYRRAEGIPSGVFNQILRQNYITQLTADEMRQIELSLNGGM